MASVQACAICSLARGVSAESSTPFSSQIRGGCVGVRRRSAGAYLPSSPAWPDTSWFLQSAASEQECAPWGPTLVPDLGLSTFAQVPPLSGWRLRSLALLKPPGSTRWFCLGTRFRVFVPETAEAHCSENKTANSSALGLNKGWFTSTGVISRSALGTWEVSASLWLFLAVKASRAFNSVLGPAF